MLTPRRWSFRQSDSERVVVTLEQVGEVGQLVGGPVAQLLGEPLAAMLGDVGEPEWKKEQRQKRAARKKGTGGLSDWLPW